MFLVFKLCKWENIKWDSLNSHKLPFPVEIIASEGEAGFLKVFTNYENALEFSGNRPDLVAEIKEEEGGGE